MCVCACDFIPVSYCMLTVSNLSLTDQLNSYTLNFLYLTSPALTAKFKDVLINPIISSPVEIQSLVFCLYIKHKAAAIK